MFRISYDQVADSISDWRKNQKSKDQTFLFLFSVRLRDLMFSDRILHLLS